MSASFDLHTQITALQAFFPRDWGQTAASSVPTNTNGAYGVQFILSSRGLNMGETVFIMEHSDEQFINYVTVPDEFIVGDINDFKLTSTSEEIKRIGYVGKRQYVKVSFTAAPAVAGIWGVTSIKYMHRHEPTAEQ